MKLFLPFMTFAMASATRLAKLPDSVKVDSKLGSAIMENARKLNNNNNNNEVDYTWVEDFSIKFQGCHHISQWNDNVQGEDDVRIATKRLVRFRLCPSDTCSKVNAGGCNAGYGDYVVDMETFLGAYVESAAEYNQAMCEYHQNNAGCDNGGDYCLYDYYVSQGVEDICAEQNPYENNYDGNNKNNNAFEVANYVACAQAQFGNNRRLDNGNYYYMGPYCAEQGGAIFMGLFTDDSCTTFADDYGGQEAYYSLTGSELPYGSSNIVTMDCYSCQEAESQFNYNYNGNQKDQNDEDGVNEMCETIYAAAGKCESSLDVYGVSPNYNACSYIQGIQVIRKNGIIISSGSKANKSASIFIGIFVVAFVLLSAYVYYLKTKLDRATINLAE